jgi:hypothetical protein
MPASHPGGDPFSHPSGSSVRSLELLWELGKFSQPARRASVKRILELWQEGQRPEAANRYLEALGLMAGSKYREHQTTEVADLPSL